MTCKDVAELAPLYLSRELDSARAADFAAHLQVCSACAAELAQQQEIDARLREGVLARRPDTAALEERVRRAVRKKSPARWLIAAAAGVAAVVLGYQALSGVRTPRICAEAATDHRREVVNSQRRTWLDEPGAIRSLAERYGVSPSVVSAISFPGFRLDRARLCRLDNHVFLHLVYTDGEHEFSVYLRPRDSAALGGKARGVTNGKTIYAADVGGEHLGYFQADHLTALVVTDQPESALRFARLAAGAL